MAAHPGDGMARRAWGNYQTTPTVALACDLSFAERNEKQFLNTAPWLNSNFQEG
jgi:hypothetical protein